MILLCEKALEHTIQFINSYFAILHVFTQILRRCTEKYGELIWYVPSVEVTEQCIINYVLCVIREMAELHRNSAALDSKAQEAALSAEMQVREELKLTIEKQQQQHKWAIDSLNMQVIDK